jgi:hypothetical protein
MFLILQVATVLVAVAISLALAHALALPGKMRLDKETYLVRDGHISRCGANALPPSSFRRCRARLHRVQERCAPCPKAGREKVAHPV